MPRSTYSFAFEMKILMGLGSLFDGERVVSIRTLEGDWLHHKESALEIREAWREELYKRDTPHVFYDPFDAPEYTYISWHRITKQEMEGLIGQKFLPRDFYGKGDQKREEFPLSWSVMF